MAIFDIEREVVFLAARRTPFGTFGGALKDRSAIDLGARAAEAALEASGLAAVPCDGRASPWPTWI